jgi:hypothetical protein
VSSEKGLLSPLLLQRSVGGVYSLKLALRQLTPLTWTKPSRKRLRVAHDSFIRDYEECIAELNLRQERLNKQSDELERKKGESAQENGNADAADDDIVEVNAGGKIVVAKRRTLTQMQGTRLDALFSGRWDKKLRRDCNGHIFLDVDPTCFEAIVYYLNERMISSEENPPTPPIVDEEHKDILLHQLHIFGLAKIILPTVEIPDTSIINLGQVRLLHKWLGEDGSNGKLTLLYRGVAIASKNFHNLCDDKGPTLTIIETTCGLVIGGYTSIPWSSTNEWSADSKAFLFVLSGNGVTSPHKMMLKNPSDDKAIYCGQINGPYFGRLDSLLVQSGYVYVNSAGSYNTEPIFQGTHKFTMRKMEVFSLSTDVSTLMAHGYILLVPEKESRE